MTNAAFNDTCAEPRETVQCDADVWGFAIDQFDAIHKTCDAARIPKGDHTAAQRVALMAAALGELRQLVPGMRPWA